MKNANAAHISFTARAHHGSSSEHKVRNMLEKPSMFGLNKANSAGPVVEVIRNALVDVDLSVLHVCISLNKHWRSLVQIELKRRWNSMLARSVDDVDGLTRILSKYGCAISGSSALWFVIPSKQWRPNDHEHSQVKSLR